MGKAITDLDIFLSLAITGSMTETGRQLGISPAMVSNRLSGIEKRLQKRLFYRPAGRLKLTEDGHYVLKHVAIAAILTETGIPVDGTQEAEAAGERKDLFLDDPRSEGV
jgi:hypothetical protein